MSKGATYVRAHPSKWPGVYKYVSDERKHMRKPDVLFVISFKNGTRKIWEKVGWISEGYTPEIAADVRAKRVRDLRHAGEVKTAPELREERARENATLHSIAKVYMEEREKAKWGKFDTYRYEKHIDPILGKRTIKSLVPRDMGQLKEAMTGKAPATIWGALELIRRITNYGFKNGLSPRLPFVIKMPERNNQVVEYLTPEQAKTFLDVLSEWKDADVARMLKLAMFTGLRRGEIFKLENRDLDFKQGLITLRDPKGRKTTTIPMNPVAEGILQEQLAWRDEKKPDSPFIFPGRYGGQRVDSSVVEKIKEKAGLPKSFRIFHGLRHHFGVTLANSGQFSMDMIAELLTHKDPRLTAQRYAQFLPEAKQNAAKRAAQVISEHLITEGEG